jgi:hypothetical protein
MVPNIRSSNVGTAQIELMITPRALIRCPSVSSGERGRIVAHPALPAWDGPTYASGSSTATSYA